MITDADCTAWGTWKGLTNHTVSYSCTFWVNQSIGVVIYFHSMSRGSGEGAWLELSNSNYGNKNNLIL